MGSLRDLARGSQEPSEKLLEIWVDPDGNPSCSDWTNVPRDMIRAAENVLKKFRGKEPSIYFESLLDIPENYDSCELDEWEDDSWVLVGSVGDKKDGRR
jgi:hypothetical protein